MFGKGHGGLCIEEWKKDESERLRGEGCHITFVNFFSLSP